MVRYYTESQKAFMWERWRKGESSSVSMSLSGLEGFGADLKALRARFDLVIARIDQRVKTLVEANPDRRQHVTQLRTIYVVGPVVSAALVNILERVP